MSEDLGPPRGPGRTEAPRLFTVGASTLQSTTEQAGGRTGKGCHSSRPGGPSHRRQHHHKNGCQSKTTPLVTTPTRGLVAPSCEGNRHPYVGRSFHCGHGAPTPSRALGRPSSHWPPPHTGVFCAPVMDTPAHVIMRCPCLCGMHLSALGLIHGEPQDLHPDDVVTTLAAGFTTSTSRKPTAPSGTWRDYRQQQPNGSWAGGNYGHKMRMYHTSVRHLVRLRPLEYSRQSH